ncbi:MAG TPA: hypothetical protein VFS27_08880 [Blastocatellia bacterium]|jgi:hypothetical protein|nr:hypothetical protein [Blastocatellia bacterium]
MITAESFTNSVMDLCRIYGIAISGDLDNIGLTRVYPFTPHNTRRQLSPQRPARDFFESEPEGAVTLIKFRFSSAALKGLYELCEFENEHLPPFVDILYIDLKDGGPLVSVLLEYKAELIEQPLLVTQLA